MAGALVRPVNRECWEQGSYQCRRHQSGRRLPAARSRQLFYAHVPPRTLLAGSSPARRPLLLPAAACCAIGCSISCCCCRRCCRGRLVFLHRLAPALAAACCLLLLPHLLLPLLPARRRLALLLAVAGAAAVVVAAVVGGRALKALHRHALRAHRALRCRHRRLVFEIEQAAGQVHLHVRPLCLVVTAV